MKYLVVPSSYTSSNTAFLCSLILYLWAVASFASEPHELTKKHCPNTHGAIVIGTALHPELNTLLYCEYHILQISESAQAARNLVVRYFDGNNNEIASKSVVYGTSPVQPEITQKDFRSGEQRIAQRNAEGQWVMTYQESKRDRVKTQVVELGEMGVVDSGFNQFIKLHWDTLQSDDPLVVEFLSVPHLKTIKLQVKRVECEPEASGERVCFGIQINNAFLRLITGELYLEYSSAKQLVLFSGVVNIRNEKEKTQKAVIQYTYYN
ncbi:hypothetical protein [Saccharophagus degradans]|uniref:Secreted protein n=1 Tax=Saccharophagus degradans TaxID=86304 RepID=A0AAW7X9Y5_9GAMM|nr:hypothetical protein [Saccharophagus degradans]MDO6424473.1 hypothetical protein [Saccharophagus degradans]MDO6608904.1 hypothetical protein [Saccharophagus degradans]